MNIIIRNKHLIVLISNAPSPLIIDKNGKVPWKYRGIHENI